MRFVDRYRTELIFIADLTMAAVSLPLAIYLRIGAEGVRHQLDTILLLTVVFTAIAAAVLVHARLFRVAWRYISAPDALLIARTSTMINVGFLALMFFFARLDGVPRASVAINVFILAAMMIGARLLMRMRHERRAARPPKPGAGPQESVLLIGATDEAEAFILTMTRDRNSRYRVIGVIATSATGNRPVGSLIRGTTILGTLDDLDRILGPIGPLPSLPERLIIADTKLRGKDVQGIFDLAVEKELKISHLPALSQLGASGQQIIRPIEVADLLRRPQASLDRAAMTAMVTGKRVLVTGAGGSIGSELVRQIAALKPARLSLLDSSEFNLYDIDRQLSDSHPALPRIAHIGNIRDGGGLEALFSSEKPELVFHAAALKHVPLLESQPAQTILTNVMGTRLLADACVRHNVETMVMISTDKAAHPVSIMGASKRIAESYCQSLDIEQRKLGGPRFVTVRFGNVLGSAGSVVPLFEKQIGAGGPVTVTHPEMTRYFMTIHEAVELVLQAATLGAGEVGQGGIVVLDMGQPVNILKMAKQMITLAGFTPDREIKIVITGLRPGERLTETLFQQDEELMGTSHESLMIAKPRVADYTFVNRIIEQLVETALRHDDTAVLELIGVAVGDFNTRRAITFAQGSAEEFAAAQLSEV